jgi:alpha-tubulin suppressor-like RCC1 family protein
MTGLLGNGSTPQQSTVPVQAIGITDATAVAVGGYVACALEASGRVMCWGNTALGAGTGGWSSVPVHVVGINDATAISVGSDHACALLSAGTVQCWGHGEDFGNLYTGSEAWSPVDVPGLTNVTAIAAGNEHTCALIADGTVDCLGYLEWWAPSGGADTGVRFADSPLPIAGVNDAVALSAGYLADCVVHVTGTVSCLGNNADGQLGDGTSTNSITPVDVAGLTNVTAVAITVDHSCALLNGGSVSCWGDNARSQLGDGTTNASLSPVTVVDLAPVSSMASNDTQSTCVLRADGALRCWGYNGQGQLGNGTTNDSPAPVSVIGLL